MKTHTLYIFAVLLLFAASCTQEDYIAPEDKKVPITFDVRQHNLSGNSRANIYGDENSSLADFVNDPANNPNDFYDATKGGGNFWLQAFVNGKYDANQGAIKYSEGRVWWNRDIAEREINKGPSGNPQRAWQFLEGNEQSGTTYEVYWPKNEDLNFLAIMPWNLGEHLSDTYDIIYGYNESNGFTMECQLPETYNANDETQELVYSFASSRNMLGGTVPIRFVHPFAIVRFRLNLGSYRLNIQEIQFNGIKLAGSFSNKDNTYQLNAQGEQTYSVPDSCWTPYESTTIQTQTYQINKKIPSEINYNAVFGGPFLVIPQDITGVKMNITAKRIDAGNSEYTKTNVAIATGSVTKWEPGKMYTYNLTLGDGYAEVVFDVDVEPWGIEGETIKEIE